MVINQIHVIFVILWLQIITTAYNVDSILLDVYHVDRIILDQLIFHFPIWLQEMNERWNDHSVLHTAEDASSEIVVASLGLWVAMLLVDMF